MPADKPTELSRIKLKTRTRQPVPMISKHSAHSTSLPVSFRTWLWRYKYLLLLISMLWHRQAIFESNGMHGCQFQHLCVLIFNCALALAIYIFVGLILMLWHMETHVNPQRNRWIIVDPAGIELTTSRLRQLRQLPVVQHVRFTPLKLRQKTQLQWHARGCTGQLTTRLECTGVNFNTCVCWFSTAPWRWRYTYLLV